MPAFFNTFLSKGLYSFVLFVFILIHSSANSQILFWNFDDGDIDPGNSIGEVKLIDGTPLITSNTGTGAGFDNDLSGGQALYYTSWNAENLYYEIAFNGEGYKNFQFSFDHRRTSTGPQSFILSYSVNGGQSFDILDEFTEGIPISESFSNTLADLSGYADLNGQGDIRIRIEVITPASAGGGRFYLDNVSLSAEEVVPTQLWIASINEGQLPEAGQDFDIVIEARDADGLVGKIGEDTQLQLAKTAGDGGGGIVDFNNTILYSGEKRLKSTVSYDDGETNVEFTLSVAFGETLSPHTTVAFTILSAEPTLPVSGITAAPISNTQIRIDVDRDLMAGDRILVLGSITNVVETLPSDGVGFEGHLDFGTGEEVGDDVFVLYSDSENSIVVSNLNPFSEYFFSVFGFNGENGTENYLNEPISTSTFTCVTPTLPVSNVNVTNPTLHSLNIIWEGGDAQSWAVMMNDVNEFEFSFEDGIPLASEENEWQKEGEQLVFLGTGNLAQITGLDPNTTYFFRIVGLNCENEQVKYSPDAVEYSYTTPSFYQGFTNCGALDWTSYSIRGNSWNCGSGSMSISGIGEASSTEAWLVSPAIDFSEFVNASLEFKLLSSGTDDGEILPLKVFFSDEYPGFGNPALDMYHWESLPFSYPSGSNNWASSGYIDLSDKDTENGFLVFQYVSSGNSEGNASSWLIDDIVIENRECTFPSSQSNSIFLDQLSSTSVRVNFEPGDGDGLVGVMTEGIELTNFPANGVFYVSDPQFGEGDAIGESHFVVLDQQSANTIISGLLPNTYYTLQLFDFNYCASEGIESYYNVVDNGANSITFKTSDLDFSEILLDESFTYPVAGSFSYQDFQANTLNSSNSLEIARFVCKDQDDDALPTLLSELSFKLIGYENIYKIALFDGTTNLQEVVSDDKVTFSGLSFSVADDGSRPFSIRVSFQESVEDNQQMQIRVFNVKGGDPGSFSQFNELEEGGLATPIDNEENIITVNANQLVFDPIVTKAIVDAPFEVLALAVDGHGNLDQDANAMVSLVSDGTGVLAFGGAKELVNGQVLFGSVSYDTPESISISTSSDYPTEATSASFSFQNGLAYYEFTDYQFDNDGNAPSTWEDSLISVSDFSKGSNVLKLAIPAHDVFSCRGFATSVIEPTDSYYLEFSLEPNAGNEIGLDEISFRCKRSSQGPSQFVIRSSLDGFTANVNETIYSVETAFESFSIPLTGFDGLNSAISFRIYLFNSGSGNGTFQIDDVLVLGNSSDLLAPAFNEGFPQIENYFADGFEISHSVSESGNLYVYWQDHDAPPPTSGFVVENFLYQSSFGENEVGYFQMEGLVSSQKLDVFLVIEDADGNVAMATFDDLVVANNNSILSSPDPGNQIPSQSIFSSNDSPDEVQKVFRFAIHDQGEIETDDDGLPTSVYQLSFFPGVNNTASWEDVIGGVKLENSNTSQVVSIADTIIANEQITLAFETGSLVIPANSSEDFTLSVWLKKSVVEGEILEFTIAGGADDHHCLADNINSSQFQSPFGSATVSNQLPIEVQATQLSFSGYPGNYVPGEDFGFTITATDANGNVDADEIGSVALSLFSGAGSLQAVNGGELNVNLENGTFTWTEELRYTGAGDFFSIQATIAGDGLNGTFHTGLISAGNGDLVVRNGEHLGVQSDLVVYGDLIIEEGGELTLSESIELELKGEFENSGVFTDEGGTISFSGVGVQIINSKKILRIENIILKENSQVANEAEIRLANKIKIEQNATFDADGADGTKEFILLSNKNRTAQIAPVEMGGQILGNVTWRRFIGDRPVAGWYFLTTPIKDQTVVDWQDDVKIQGMDNQHPNANKVMYFYKEPIGSNTFLGSDGWRPVGESNTILSQHGVDLYLFKSTFKKGALILDNRGEPFIGDGSTAGGTYSYPLSFTSTAYDGGGWNLVPNPYLGELHWESITRSDELLVNNAFYIWDTENRQYSTYVDGISQNGGQPYIPAGRSFFVKANGSGQSLIFSESSKSQNLGTTFRNAEPSVIRFFLENNSGDSDEVVIGIKENSTFGFDPGSDAIKFPSGFNLSSKTEERNLAINTFPDFKGLREFPLVIDARKKGLVRLKAKTSEFRHAHYLYLFDRVKSEFLPVTENFKKTIRIGKQGNPSFDLVMASPVYVGLSSAKGKVGDTIKIKLKAESLVDVKVLGLGLTWNADYLQFVGWKNQDDVDGPEVSIEQGSEEGTLSISVSKMEQALGEKDSTELLSLDFLIVGGEGSTNVNIVDSLCFVTRVNSLEMPLDILKESAIEVLRTSTLNCFVTDAFGNPMSETKLTIAEDRKDTISQEGYDYFEVPIAEGSNYELRVTKNEVPNHPPVSVNDIVQLRNQLSGRPSFLSPFQFIAADLDESKSLEEEDMGRLKTLFFQRNQDFPNEWRFVAVDSLLFEDPFEYETSANFHFGEKEKVQFVGLINGDVDLSYESPLAATRDIRVVMNDVIVEKETLELGLSFEEETACQAFNVKFDYDEQAISFSHFESMLGGKMDFHTTSHGSLEILYEKGGAEEVMIPANQTFLTLTFNLNDAGGEIDMTSLPTIDAEESHLVDGSNGVARITSSQAVTGLIDTQPEFSVYPNPVGQMLNVGFNLTKSDVVKIKLINVFGDEVFKFQKEFPEGKNEIGFTRSELIGQAKGGVYFLETKTEHFSQTSKVMFK